MRSVTTRNIVIILAIVVMMLTTAGSTLARSPWESIPNGYLMLVTTESGIPDVYLGGRKVKARLRGSNQSAQAIRSSYGRWIEVKSDQTLVVRQRGCHYRWRHPGSDEGFVAFQILEITDELLAYFGPFVVND